LEVNNTSNTLAKAAVSKPMHDNLVGNMIQFGEKDVRQKQSDSWPGLTERKSKKKRGKPAS